MNELLLLVLNASIKAGEAIMEVYEGEHNVRSKLDESPLTQADINANTVINSFLKTTSIPIISEENKQIEYSIRKQWNKCWMVDPLDGTKEFIKRNGEFTVNIALIEEGKPVLGVIFVPVSKTLFFTNSDGSASFKMTLRNFEKLQEEIFETAKEISPLSNKSDVVRVVGSRSHMSSETTDYIEELKKKGKKVEIVSKGSSLKFCLVAEGSADVYPRFAPTMEWDTAAGQAICNAVGLKVISQETNKELLYNKENLLNPWFIVSK